jgi:arylsulfatase A-like enzyme
MSTGRTDAMRLAALLALIGVWLALPAAADEAPGKTAPGKTAPNVLLIVLDDIGFTDLGAYGSEIRTPNIDALARRGVRFSQFRVAPTCAPTRAMLMTGVDSHRTGLPTLEHLVIPAYRGQPGHEGSLNRSVATLAEHLRPAGYQSFIAGKWHLGRTQDSLPVRRGFERSFILDSSGADNWEHQPYLPHYRRAEWWRDDQPVETLPSDFYSSAYLADTLAGYIDAADPGRPFFAVLALQANHIPVQAPRRFVDGYQGVYDAGWEALGAQRRAAAIALGLIPADAPTAPTPPTLRRWDSLSAGERARSIESRKVAAGMLEAADHHIGRLLARVEAAGRLSDTLVIVLSDNGPEYNDPTARASFRLWLWSQGYGRTGARLGERGTYAAIGAEWAAASAAPLSLFKFHAADGGMRVPLIVAGPGVEAGALRQSFAYVTDIAPTILEAAGAAPLEGVSLMSGRSLLPVLTGAAQAVRGPDDVIGMEMSGQIALLRGRFKLVRSLPPHGDGAWRLYDIVADPAEARDLAAAQPALFASMRAAYDAYAAREGVIAVPDDFDAEALIARRGLEAALRANWLWLAGGAAALAGLIGLGVAALLRRRPPAPKSACIRMQGH